MQARGLLFPKIGLVASLEELTTCSPVITSLSAATPLCIPGAPALRGRWTGGRIGRPTAPQDCMGPPGLVSSPSLHPLHHLLEPCRSRYHLPACAAEPDVRRGKERIG